MWWWPAPVRWWLRCSWLGLLPWLAVEARPIPTIVVTIVVVEVEAMVVDVVAVVVLAV